MLTLEVLASTERVAAVGLELSKMTGPEQLTVEAREGSPRAQPGLAEVSLLGSGVEGPSLGRLAEGEACGLPSSIFRTFWFQRVSQGIFCFC